MRHLPEPDTAAAVDFLEAAQPGGPWHVVAIKPEGVGVEARTFTNSEKDELVEWIDGWQGEWNLYWHVNKLSASVRHRKARKDDVAAAYFLHIDVDDASSLLSITAFKPPPTAIVFSGGGFQAFWRFQEEQVDLKQVEARNQEIAARLGGDNCHNVDRVMRLPGSLNVPNAKKRANGRVVAAAYVVTEHTDWSRKYSLSNFDLPQPPTSPSAVAVRAAATSRDPGALEPLFIDQLPIAPTAELRGLIESGDDLERPRGGATSRFPSRSEAVFFIACELARLGCASEQIAGVLINSRYRISESILERHNPKRYALKQGRAGVAAAANGWPDSDKTGQPRPTMRNAIVALRRLDLNFEFDLFRHRKKIDGHELESFAGAISDDAILVLRGIVVDRFGFDPRSDHVRDAVTLLCLQNAVHPIREYISGLVWDGLPRIDRFLLTYLGADDTLLNAEIGRIMLVAAVRRVRQPGAKFDQIVVFEGPQGSGKSTVVKILAGPGNHSDQEILSLDAKAQMELIEGVWLYELGEVEGLNRAEVNKIKAFASRQVDKARPAYGYFSVERPRQAIFIGTTNDDKYLRDQTGNRRFWPVRTGTIDLEALARDRDQLWAEAAHRDAQGDPITLPESLWEAARKEQSARLEDDPWADKLASVRGQAFGDVARVATADLLADILGVAIERQNQSHTKRLSTVMKSLGWKSTKYRLLGQIVRGYERSKSEGHQDDRFGSPRPY